MDLFYLFFHKAIDIARNQGEISFITTNYYPTDYGGKKLRLDFNERVSIRKLINFNELKIFESALGQHNLITMLVKENNLLLKAENSIVKKTGVANTETLRKIFNKEEENTDYYYVKQAHLYEGEEKYIRLLGVYEGIDDNSLQSILSKMKLCQNKFGDICLIKQGIVSGADKVTNKHISEYDSDWKKEKVYF